MITEEEAIKWIEDNFEKSEVVRASHLLYADIKNYFRLNKFQFYSILYKYQIQADGKDTDGSYGYKLRFKTPSNDE